MSNVRLDRNSLEKTREIRSKEDPGVTCVAFFKKQRPWVFDSLIDWFQESLCSQLSEWLEKDWGGA